MFVFKDYLLPKNGSLRNALKAIYGLGNIKIAYICDLFGYGLSYKIDFLSRFSFDLLVGVLREHYLLGDDLKRAISSILHKYISIESYRGIRIKYCLPSRGQRTHSNYGTVRRLGKFENR